MIRPAFTLLTTLFVGALASAQVPYAGPRDHQCPQVNQVNGDDLMSEDCSVVFVLQPLEGTLSATPYFNARPTDCEVASNFQTTIKNLTLDIEKQQELAALCSPDDPQLPAIQARIARDQTFITEIGNEPEMSSNSASLLIDSKFNDQNIEKWKTANPGLVQAGVRFVYATIESNTWSAKLMNGRDDLSDTISNVQFPMAQGFGNVVNTLSGRFDIKAAGACPFIQGSDPGSVSPDFQYNLSITRTYTVNVQTTPGGPVAPMKFYETMRSER